MRSNIARRQELTIYCEPEQVHTFPFHFYYIRVSITKSLKKILYNFHQQNVKNNVIMKQTKFSIQNESKPIVAISVSKAVT